MATIKTCDKCKKEGHGGNVLDNEYLVQILIQMPIQPKRFDICISCYEDFLNNIETYIDADGTDGNK